MSIALGFLVYYSHMVHPLWFGEFLFQMPLESLVHNSRTVHLPITWGVFIPMLLEYLVHGLRAVHPLSLGEFLGSILLESLVHAVRPLLLGECLVQCLMCGSRTVHPLLLGEFLGPMLLDCLVCNLCIVYPLLIFGEFLLPLYFRKTLFLVYAILLPLFTWAFCSFSFTLSSVC